MLCLKKAGLALIISSIIPLVGKASVAQNASCANSWTNPSTGLEECLDRQLKASSGTSNESNDKGKEQLNDISDLPGYIKVAETRRDRVYIRANSIKIRKMLIWHIVNFGMSIISEVAPRKNISYTANCDTNTLSMNGYAIYGSNNNQ